MLIRTGHRPKIQLSGFRLILVFAWLVLHGCAQPNEEVTTQSSTPADLLLHSGIVISVDADNTQYEAIALHQGTIQALGSTEALKSRIGPDTK